MNDLRSGVRLLSLVDDTYLNDMGITDRPRPRRFLQFSRQPRTLNLSQMAGALADIDQFAHAVRSSGLQRICDPEVSSRHSIATGNKSGAGEL